MTDAMTPCPGYPGVHVDLGKLTADVAAGLERARAEGREMERAALTEAGRLLPEGGETRQEWGVRYIHHLPAWAHGKPYHRAYRDQEEARDYWAAFASIGGTLAVRSVTTWPDGTTLTGPWRPVDTGGERVG